MSDQQDEVIVPVEGRSMTLTQHLLGLRPFVLVEFFDGGDDEDDLRANISAGGGIGTTEDIRAALRLALDNLPDDDLPNDERDGGDHEALAPPD